jgi:hypothetical protein
MPQVLAVAAIGWSGCRCLRDARRAGLSSILPLGLEDPSRAQRHPSVDLLLTLLGRLSLQLFACSHDMATRAGTRGGKWARLSELGEGGQRRHSGSRVQARGRGQSRSNRGCRSHSTAQFGASPKRPIAHRVMSLTQGDTLGNEAVLLRRLGTSYGGPGLSPVGKTHRPF